MPKHYKFTSDIADTIIEQLKLGMPKSRASWTVGIDRTTFYNWLEASNPDHDKYDSEHPAAFYGFYVRTNKAQAEFIQRRVAQIENAAVEGDMKVVMWQLERMFPNEYGATSKHQVEHSKAEAEPMEIRVRWVSPGDVLENDP